MHVRVHVRMPQSAPNAARRQWIFADLRFQRQKGVSNAKEVFFQRQKGEIQRQKGVSTPKGRSRLFVNESAWFGRNVCVNPHGAK